MKSRRRCLHVLASCLVVLIVLAVFGAFGISMKNASPMNSAWNDEAFYYGQIKAVQRCLVPQGYYGYNDSRALIGGFGTWSPAIIFAYAFLSFPFSFLSNSIWITNLILIGLSMFFLYELTDSDLESTVLFSMLCLLFYVIRYAYSGMTEALFFGIMIVLGGMVLNGNRKWRPFAVASITFMTLIRPYSVLLYPLFMFDTEHKKQSILRILLLSLVSILVFFVIGHFFCAPYLFPSLRLNDILALFHGGVGESLVRLLQYMKCNLGNFLEYMLRFTSGDRHAVGEVLYFLTGIWLFVSLFKKADRTRIYLFAVAVILPFASMNLYSVGETDRHLFPYMIMLLIYLLNDLRINRARKRGALAFALVCVLCCFFYFRNKENQWETQDYSAYQIKEGSVRLEKTKDGYENTVAMSWRDDSFHAVYSLPSGFGVSLCDVEYLSVPEEVKSRYVLVEKEGELFPVYKNRSVVFENDTIALFDLKMSE